MVCCVDLEGAVLDSHVVSTLIAAVNFVLIVDSSCQKPSSTVLEERKMFGKTNPERSALIVKGRDVKLEDVCAGW